MGELDHIIFRRNPLLCPLMDNPVFIQRESNVREEGSTRKKRKCSSSDTTGGKADSPDGVLDFLEDISIYPSETLSSEYKRNKLILEERASKTISVESLGNGYIPSTIRIIHYWFDSIFGDSNRFFKCSTPSKPMTKLCDLLTRSPFFCIYTAYITMNPIVPLNHDKTCKKQQNSRNPTSSLEKIQSITGVSSNPPDWIIHKNRRVFVSHLQTRNGYKSDRKIKCKDNISRKRKLSESHETYNTQVFLDDRAAESDTFQINAFEEEEEVMIDFDTDDAENIKQSPQDEEEDEIMNGYTSEKLPGKRKTRSTWNLVAYIVLDRYSHSASFIRQLLHESMYSKGNPSKTRVLFDLAKKHRLPIWIWRKALEDIEIEDVDELYKSFRYDQSMK